jgi:hypothetical protein
MAKKKEVKPRKPWHGAQKFDKPLRIPCHVVMLCKLMNTHPSEILQGFLDCLAVEKNNKNPEAAKQATVDFFIHYGLGKDYYSEDEIRTMFSELKQVNDLWPNEPATSKFIDHHAYWRGKYWKHWFKKWYWKIRRRKITPVDKKVRL